jgi:hypothetical protein
MGLLVVFIIIIAAIGAFAVMSQGSNQQTALAVPSLAGGALIILAFFALPWVRLSGVGDLIRRFGGTSLPPELVDQIGDPELVATIQELLNDVTRVTGWTFVTELPTVGEGLRMILFFTLAAGLVALVGGIVGMTGGQAGRMVGVMQIAWSALAALMLLFSMGRIRTFGLDLGLIGSALSMLGLTVGTGVWITFLGLAASIGGGVLMLNTTSQPHVRRDRRKIGRSSRLQSRRR